MTLRSDRERAGEEGGSPEKVISSVGEQRYMCYRRELRVGTR